MCCVVQDMSYPAASLIVSNALPESRQGVGASMINAVVNLSVSFGLGVAGTVQSRVIAHGNGSASALLRAQRSAHWVGVALAGFGVAVTVLFVRVRPMRETAKGDDHEQSGTEKRTSTDKQLSARPPSHEAPAARGPSVGDHAATAKQQPLETTEVSGDEAL